MSSPFNNDAGASRPTWTDVSAPNGDFTIISKTGQIQILGGYGLGGYGEGDYGTGNGITIAVGSVLTAQWTLNQTK